MVPTKFILTQSSPWNNQPATIYSGGDFLKNTFNNDVYPFDGLILSSIYPLVSYYYDIVLLFFPRGQIGYIRYNLYSYINRWL